MFAVRVATGATFALLYAWSVLAVPAPTSTVDSQCPQPWTTTYTQTLSIIAPTTTGPFKTTTFTETGWNYPLTTSTEIGTYTYSGPIWSGSPTYSTVTVDYTSTYTEVFTYSNYYGTFPSNCNYP
ncbi:hypothetical protein POSPLADRAFT_1053311 [Postia placenta MAD-698-R-SB12]|uniref:Uncharacterized protein n=1 Tax=Postia placenta MAD-698-R-SB12 TaxID=670580 RepID=A0A1X6NE84_9APHY|nr:hypothetical protein POSPLADRAFT_1053311 [Postia placenta MAD-698-R-SB12]OSX66683.1 hypothetical protein POSPLADRAFT_1053311 [Postia placenta MAD-698-R-SB12]